ncbi:hypothetical protein IE81DRAFT_21949 [Ceraceosorus guamensis]|uniref:DAPG hydrolase PhiG domain-containing protein n=1 Tax=Ceraceosorus guamensis TaxID=1522189 RepID=A0A316VPN6_9BASI|nr:hypothetical protein IE81DRAFT_21949 [Ceraceosorus guamensis]PWN39537.1 hypothetical protein IE81DRAFT_21949 [Ceraceosorus guamensis]
MKFVVASIIAAALGIASTTHGAPTLPTTGPLPNSYYSLQYQDNLVKNQRNIAGQPFAKYFRPDLFLYKEAIDAGKQSLNCNTQALKQDLSDIRRLQTPITNELPGESGWCSYPDGGGYVASKTYWPGVTGEMITWWFWWHSAASVRYSLWHPWGHVSIDSTYKDRLDNPNLLNQQKYIGAVHHINEIIGDQLLPIDIHFKNVSDIGLDPTQLAPNGIVASASGEIYAQGTPLKIANMYHFWHEVPGGLILRSRYFLGNNVQVQIPILGQFLPINQIAALLGIKNIIAGRPLSLQQFFHDSQEMTHLASILPDLFKEYGQLSKSGGTF